MKETGHKELKFKKEELMKAERYQGKTDLVGALLEEGREYSLPEVDAAIKTYLKGRVK